MTIPLSMGRDGLGQLPLLLFCSAQAPEGNFKVEKCQRPSDLTFAAAVSLVGKGALSSAVGVHITCRIGGSVWKNRTLIVRQPAAHFTIEEGGNVSYPPAGDENSDYASRERWAAIILVLGGLILLVVLTLLVRGLVSRWQVSDWPSLCLEGIVLLCILGISIAMILYPLRHIGVFNLIIRVALWPLRVTVVVGHYYMLAAAPFIALVLIVAIPVLVWFVLHTIGLIPLLEGASYITLTVSSVAFTLWGENITRFITPKYLRRKKDFSKLFSLMRPNLLRAYTYGIMALAYILANIEKFSNATLLRAPWWTTYKEVLVEILLTYVAVDSVLVAWRDHQESKGPHT